jgi:5-histidylcysteine sulfoxide synthase/putative 4-mercaptohistidine N1-methyltranferase
MGDDPEQKREEIREYFHNTFTLYERLFTIMKSDAGYYHRPEPLRHPIIFYYGHTATFFINKLMLAGLIDQRIDPHLESIFAVGVDEMSWDDLNEQNYDWPSVEATTIYRNRVRDLMDHLITTIPLTLPITWENPWWVILMGIEHERIHLETSSVLMRQLPLEMVQSTQDWQAYATSGPIPLNELIPIPATTISIGKSHENDTFYGWDNEYGTHTNRLEPFKASKYLVTNGEFLAFVEDGGYDTKAYWSDEGYQWREFKQQDFPVFWFKQEENFLYRTLTELIPLPHDWPVDVNAHEAEAYCNWLSQKEGKTLTLPTEDEWYAMRKHAKIDSANIDLTHCSATPVTLYPQGKLYDVIGNVWQWTSTPIYPFDGFATHPIYDDFTTPTYDGKHNLIKGGSWISTGNESLKESRYAFRKHFFQHAGFRYVESSNNRETQTNVYESDFSIAQYCEAHWGEEYFGVKNFPKAIADYALAFATEKTKALDIGCGIGRSSFELAREFAQVIGIDFSARFISLATRLKEQGSLFFTLPIEGELEEHKNVQIDQFDLEQERKKVAFWQGDASNLKPHFKDFDLILAANLIDRLYSPKKFLKSIHTRLNDNGILILTSPYSWDEAHTAREEWIGGFKRDGENVTTLDGLQEILTNFELIETEDLEFVTRETARKFQHSVTQISLWRKKP